MVLKKSNSRLNSGATQRAVTHKGIYKPKSSSEFQFKPYIGNVENFLQLTIHVDIFGKEAEKSIHSCLEDIYDYLALEVPDLSHLTGPDRRYPFIRPHSPSHSPTRIKDYSLDKDGRWLLPEKIDKMKTDTDFLRRVNEKLNVRFHSIHERTLAKDYKRTRTQRIKVVSASEIITNSLDKEKQKSMCRKSRTRQTYHGRGVQRSHLFSRTRAERPERHGPEEAEEKLGQLDVYLYAPYHIDTRSVGYSLKRKYAGWSHTSRLKSSTKMNGRNKGKRPCRRGYCNRDLHYDKIDEIDVYQADIDFTIFDDDDDDGGGESLFIPQRPEMKYDITDFVTISKLGLKHGKRKKGKRVARIREDDERSVQSGNQVRHSKGSFVVVSKKECQVDDDVNLAEITQCLYQPNKSSDQNNDDSCMIQISANEIVSDFEKIEVASNTRAFQLGDINDFDDGFVLVNLAVSEDQNKMFHFSQEKRDSDVLIDNKFAVKFGDSCPECFVVDCNPNKMHTSGQHWRVLIGRRREPGSDLFLVSIQDQWQTPAQTQRHLQKLTTDYKNASFSIGELINIATSLDSRELNTQPRQTSEPVKETCLSSNFVWRNMPLNIFNITESCTVEETAKILEDECAIDRNVPKRQTIFVESHGDSLVTQCDVCLVDYDYSDISTSPIVLLPCSHTYCVCCWRAHLQHCIRSGANSITCMSTNCTNVMDIATISTILPYSLVQNWQAQVRNRRIDSSPFCRWCPSLACDKVAVSRNGTLKEQFGKVITCVCQQCWCSGCQRDPHWPASCDQMAAYRKLLTKTDSKLSLPSDDIVFKVQVKQCPSCLYPIEKNKGCPTMYCSMCGYYFCWHCLKRYHTANECTERHKKTNAYSIANKLETNVLLKWYPQCLMMKRKMESMQQMKSWLRDLHMTSTSRLILSLPAYTNNQAATIAALRAEECVLFLKQAYTLQESLHVLIGFAKFGEGHTSKSLAKRVLSKMFRLDFITWRLRETILEKSLLHLCKTDKITTQLLKAGRNVMRELSVLAPALQHLSKGIETTSVGELDPGHLIRYR